MAAKSDDDVFGAPVRPKPESHEIGQSLDALSIAELDGRMELLRQEISRLEAAKGAKEASRTLADGFFKT